MLVAYDDGLTRHLAGSGHPESPDRVRVAADELRRRGMLNDRVDTRAALESGFRFIYPAIDDALDAIVGRPRGRKGYRSSIGAEKALMTNSL